MQTIGLLAAIIMLFYFLGRAADIVVAQVRLLGRQWGIDLAFLGFLLGFFTSFPELSITINAALTGGQDIALGNLLGGIPVLIGLVLGLNVVMHRKISTRVTQRPILAIAFTMLLPFALAADGQIGPIDGFVLVGAYVSILIALFLQGRHKRLPRLKLFVKTDIGRPVLYVILASIAVALLANFIIRFTETLLLSWSVPAFWVGLLLFSIGTNLPEIIISFHARKRAEEELSVSNIVGSAMANVIILGLGAMIIPFGVPEGVGFGVLALTTALIMTMLVATYRSGGRFTRAEGFALIFGYIVFVVGQVLVL